jgi:light-regulated signal transduction histidine kinase (bacteriophytochrome)
MSNDLELNYTHDYNIHDLENCADEPILKPGYIQNFGVLVVIDSDLTRVTHYSENIFEKFGVSKSKYGLNLNELDFVDLEEIKFTLDKNNIKSPFLYKKFFNINGNTYSVIIHINSQDLIVIEFEEEIYKTVDYALINESNKNISNFINNYEDQNNLIQYICDNIQKLTSYDRVMIYKFANDKSGEVIVESKLEHLESYKGLNYPAEDIPDQAREAYLDNLLRIIPDANYQPVKVLKASENIEALSMNKAILRSVSPFHIKYLQNMEVGATLVSSIIVDDQLWGLVSCHHYSPNFKISYDLRSYVALTSKLMSLEITKNKIKRLERIQENSVKVIDSFEKKLADTNSLEEALSSAQEFKELIKADGLVYNLDGQIISTNQNLQESDAKLFNYIAKNQTDEMWVVGSLCDNSIDIESEFCGFISFKFSEYPNNQIIWLRKEHIRSIDWAGKNEKKDNQDQTSRLMPRSSFKVFTEQVKNSCEPWSDQDLGFARIFGRLLKETVTMHNLEITKNNLELFAYISAHDLKQPINNIISFTDILKEEYPRVDSTHSYYIETISKSAERFKILLEDLWRYAKASQLDVNVEEVDIPTIVAAVTEMLSIQMKESRVELDLIGEFEPIMADRVLTYHVFYNLILNAIKYNDKPQKTIKISMKEISSKKIISVEDNGIGIKQQDFAKIFNMFTRLNKLKNKSGSGVGLNIVKKIVEKHGGKIWLNSQEGVYTRFLFTLEGVK